MNILCAIFGHQWYVVEAWHPKWYGYGWEERRRECRRCGDVQHDTRRRI